LKYRQEIQERQARMSENIDQDAADLIRSAILESK
jgi:hypothetical protein